MADAIKAAEERGFRRGFQFGVLAEQAKHDPITVNSSDDVVRPRGATPERKLRLIPTDQHTAEVFNFPNPTKKTAS